MGTHEYSLTPQSIEVILNALNYSIWNDREMTTQEYEITQQIINSFGQTQESDF